MIRSITLKDFKSHKESSYNLSEPILISGENGTGKSSIYEALTFSVLDYIPGINKKGEDIINISNTGSGFSVVLKSDEGIILRGFEKKSTKASEFLDVSFCDERTLANKNKAIIDKLKINSTLFDVANFLTMNSSDKSKLIQSLISSKYDKSYLFNNLSNVLPSNIMEEITEYYTDNLSLEDNVDSLIKIINSNKKIESKKLKETEGSSLKILALRDKLGSYDSDIESKLKNLMNEINDLKVQINSSKKDLARKQALEKKLKDKSLNSSNYQKTIAELESKKQSILKEIDKHLEIKFNDDFENKVKLLDNSLKKIKEEADKIKETKLTLENEIDNVTELGKKVSNISTEHKCVVNPNIPCANNANFNNSLNALRNKLRRLRNDKKALLNKYTSIGNEYNQLLSQRNSLYDEYSSQKKAIVDNQNIIKKLNLQLKNIETTLSSLKNSNEEISVLKKEIDSIKIKDYKLLEPVLLAKQNQYLDLEHKKEETIQIRQNLICLERNDAEREETEVKIENYKLAVKKLKEFKLKLLNEGITPFVNTMNEVLSNIGFNKEVFIESNSKKAIFGFKSSNKKISFDFLSTGQKLIFLIALIASIYTKEDSLRYLCLDNLESLDDVNLDLLLSNIDSLKNYFDNIVLIGVLNDRIDFNKYPIKTIQL
ncbi:AAA family ATPase [Clostridium baratii]|uniref:AAA family ATPase n=1 Tax=Clostridium baratii TaxID=1561 RepID=UPI0005F288C2|nr:AAA family ATPase [Clostridium baratii]AQM58590.1 hypothetical protein NPD11_3052 [Clostridium baratii]KJU70921.1 hypothetical protein UC77_12165 [Clostridium baratii]